MLSGHLKGGGDGQGPQGSALLDPWGPENEHASGYYTGVWVGCES